MIDIKICGMTREVDAVLAASLGVWAVGFVLWGGSPRQTNVARVREIIRELPPTVTPVGVFVDPSDDEIAAAVDAGIQVAQVHGVVPEVRNFYRPPLIIRAVHLARDGSDAIEPPVDDITVLLDAYDPDRRGGTGKTVDWNRAAAIARSRQVILAGGLTPENVGEAIAQVQPYGVDVASGVESSPGVKDHARMGAFIDAVRGSATASSRTHGT